MAARRTDLQGSGNFCSGAGSVSVLLCVMALSAIAGCARTGHQQVDLVILNARIRTMDAQQPQAQGLAVADGRILKVGDTADVLALAGEQTKILDAGGHTLLPGFNDAHLHPMANAAGSVDLGPLAVGDMEELIQTLKQRAQEVPAGEWVLGWGYDDVALAGHPGRAELDRVSTEHPVLIRHTSAHLHSANSLAYAGAGIDSATPDPEGGAFLRDADNNPSGVCQETPACNQLYSQRYPEPERGLGSSIAQLQQGIAELHALGITSIGDAYVVPSLLLLYQLALDDAHPMRVNLMFSEEHLGLAKFLHRLQEAEILHWFLDARLRIGPVKVFHGNSLSGRTCWLFQPYADRPDYYGVPPARSQDELDALVEEIHTAGMQLAVHANGDREIDMVLHAIERAVQRNPRADHRHRIEHASVLTAELLARAKQLGVVLVLHSYIYEQGSKMEAYGEQRYPWMHANRAALEAGVPIAGNSDYPVSARHVMTRLRSLSTRTSRQGKTYAGSQRLTAEQAIAIYTRGGAFASFEEASKGQLREGHLADFVILSDDPFEAEPEILSNTEALLTAVAGVPVYETSSAGLTWLNLRAARDKVELTPASSAR